MFKKIAFLFFVPTLIFFSTVHAKSKIAFDTLVVLSGKVADAQNNQAVKAKISYESLPYFNLAGIFETDQAHGKFNFPILRGTKYAVKVEAEGYQTLLAEIDLLALASDSLEANYNLEPTGAGRILRLEKLNFEAGRFIIAKESHEELDNLAKMLSDNPKMVIQLEGHTDISGNPDSNMRLSERRVEAVRDYLLVKGVNKARIKTKAYGSTRPLSRENTEEARALNRRVEVRIIKN